MRTSPSKRDSSLCNPKVHYVSQTCGSLSLTGCQNDQLLSQTINLWQINVEINVLAVPTHSILLIFLLPNKIMSITYSSAFRRSSLSKKSVGHKHARRGSDAIFSFLKCAYLFFWVYHNWYAQKI